ncbi:MAG TPA: hypothetical protein DCZ94_05895 [Lentisphaeria bacterium]|nr:MAG: hypothetical protein A2X48_07405 [Lentisphaerae bacterium GWF2_49_21]HBC86468.1 hypothetical protein [Lentisphaeria bacterium]
MPLTWNKLKEELPDWKSYRGNCPEGTFSFRIIQTAWGRTGGIHVFAERDNEGKYRFFVPLFREARKKWFIYHLFKTCIKPPTMISMKVCRYCSAPSRISEVMGK